MPEQLSLLPKAPPTSTVKFFPIDALVADSTRPPSRELVESVRALGILVPLLVTHIVGSNRYRVVDGRRRLSAARSVGLTEIPVLNFHDSEDAVGHLAQLATHALRTNNPIGEYDSICALLAAGASEKDIARDTGMPVGTIRARMKLKALGPRLEVAFRSGGMAVSVAEQVAKLPEAARHALAEKYDERGKIVDSDVHEAKSARAQAAMATLDFDAMVRATPDDTGSELSPAERLCDELDDALRAGNVDAARGLVAKLRGLVRER